MLSGLRVLELGESVPVAAAGALLRKFGANVTSLRVAVEPRLPRNQQRRLLDVLAVGKRVRVVDDPWGDADVSVAYQPEVTIADIETWNTTLEAYEHHVRARNRATWVTISPFGLHGRLSRRRGGELIAIASGGMAHYMRTSDGRPMKPAGFGVSIAAGHLAALAGLHGTLAMRSRREPIHMDLSIQDAVLVLGVFLEISHVVFDCADEGSSKNYAAPSGLIRCADGLVWITVLERHHWDGCVRALGNPPWATRIATDEQRYAESDAIRRHIESWSGELSADECADRLQKEGVPATKVSSCADLLAGAGRDVAADFFEPGPSAGELLPGLPARLTPRRNRRPSAPSGSTPRVLDVTGVLVAPLATSWLGAMGVDVLKVEDPSRMDVYRRVGPFMDRVPNPEASAYFSFVNYSKRSHAVRLDDEAGRRRLAELVAGADVVVTNLSVHRAKALGLTPDALDEWNGPSLVSSSGFGRNTAHAAYRAYGLNIQAAGGIVHLSRDRTGEPRNFGTSWADPITSIVIALSAMTQLLRVDTARHHVEVSMVEVVASQLPEYFAAISAGEGESVASENRMDHAAPHDIYPCDGEDQWIAIAVESDEEWGRLVAALGSPTPLSDDRFAHFDGRVGAADLLDAELERALSGLARDDVFSKLQDAGVACAPVWSARELVSLEHLHERGILQPVSHTVWGKRLLAGLPWRVAGEGLLPIQGSPLLGEHTSDDQDAWWADERPAPA